MCKILRALCCCFKLGHQKNSRSKGLISDQLTEEYKVPNDRFASATEVILYKGYDYENRQYLGEGAHSVVYKVMKIKDKEMFALKVISLKEYDTQKIDRRKLQFLKNEIFVVSTIRHKNITQLFDHLIVNNTSYLFLELANIGTVDEEVNTFGRMPETKAKSYFIQMGRAIEHLHHHNPPIAHRDLKLANILVHIKNGEKILKVTDFGFTRILFETANKKPFRARVAAGTPAYMSPQNLMATLHENADEAEKEKMRQLNIKPKTVNTIKADIWSLGVCLYVMVSKELPFLVREKPIDELIDTVYRMLYNQRKPIQLSDTLNNLLDRMLDPRTHSRIDIKSVLKHQWLANVSDVIQMKK